MYNLKITKEQAEILVKALDLYSRIGIGQFEEILKHPTWQRRIFSDKMSYTSLDEARYFLDNVRQIITGQRHGGIGITVSEEHNRIAYDILQVIQHKLAWDDKPEGDTTVKFHEPMQRANHKMATIEKEE